MHAEQMTQTTIHYTEVLRSPCVNPKNDRNEDDYYRSTEINDPHSRTSEYLRHDERRHCLTSDLSRPIRHDAEEGSHSHDHRQAVERYP